MFIHIGGDIVVQSKDVVAILNLNRIDRNAKKNNQLVNKGNNGKQADLKNDTEIKSIVITNDRIYYSPISSITLKKRSDCDI